MAAPPEKPPLQKPALQRPPGYRDASAPLKPVAIPPHRKRVLPPSFRAKRKRRNWCRTCCCFLCVLIFVVVTIFVIAGGIFYLWFSPKVPVFHLQSFRIPVFNVTVKQDGTYLAAQTIIRIEVKNPNSKLKVYYGRTDIKGIVGKETELRQSEVAGFTQGTNNVRSLKIESSVKNQLVDDGVGRKLKNDYKNKELAVRVVGGTRVGYVVKGWKIATVPVKVSCGGITFKNLDGGDQNAMPKCTVNLLRW